MANSFKNTTLVTKYAIKEFLNNLVMGARVDRQVDETRVFSGNDPVGATIYIRRPVYFAATDGAEISAGETSDIEQGYVAFNCDQRKKVVFSLSSEEMTLNITKAANRETNIKPAMEELAKQVETALTGLYVDVPNIVGTPGTSPSSFLVLAQAKAKLSNYGVPLKDRSVMFDPDSAVTMADGLKAVFVQSIAKTALEEATMGRYAGFNTYECQSIATHTVGISNATTGTPLVNGASQSSTYSTVKDAWGETQTLITDGWSASQTGILKAGDVFTIADVYQVNRRTRASTGNLQDFVVNADVDSGATGGATFVICPPIISDSTSPYQTVDSSPADDAAITIKSGTGSTSYRQSLAFHKNAFTLGFAQLDVPTDGVNSARQNYKGCSIRSTMQYNITLDKTVFRFDVLYGVKTQNPEFACRITD